MIESAFLLPAILNCAQGVETDARLAKDILVLGVMIYLKSIGFGFPRKLYVVLGLYGILCEIINNLSYRILEPRQELKTKWLALLKSQTQQDYKKLKKIIIHENNQFTKNI